MYDIAIIGGGINGCGIARDAAGRGYSVFLAEKNDLACGTSSGSTKLIHGGLRYLEHYEFRLVREALTEREVLWSIAPHIISPLRFVLPYHKGLRPAWLLRLGLFLYDHIGGRKQLPATRVLDLRKDITGKPLHSKYVKAFEYSDCWVDDARLVTLNARDAANRGAVIKTRTEVTQARRDGNHWRIETRDGAGKTSVVQARFLVNAAGPWVDSILTSVTGTNAPDNVRLVQGSHIVVQRVLPHDRAYIFQNADGRVLFAVPYEDDFTMIGTTDQDYTGDLDDVRISAKEIEYLCDAVSEYLRDPVTIDDVHWTFSAVRPLFDDGASAAQEATRDYRLKLEGRAGEPGLLNIFGGKITTYRRLAEEAMDRIGDELTPPDLSACGSWTGREALPGGTFPIDGVDELVDRLTTAYSFLDTFTAHRLVKSYGTISFEIFNGAKHEADAGIHFGHGLYQREIEHMVRHEWAVTVDDVLWRRSKLGLRFDKGEVTQLSEWFERNKSRLMDNAA
ncbi:MAG: glycerol-3-phosphate dehydrogenase [Hyphomicrobiaceae bacterium]